ncbi:MAG: S8 family serine peptidase [Candidatus Thorarchaeota archaeon]
MTSLNQKYNIKSIIFIAAITIVSFFPFIPSSTFFVNDKGNKPESQTVDLSSIRFIQESFFNWKEQNLNSDKNENGMCDDFEVKLKDSAESNSPMKESDKEKKKLIENLLEKQGKDPAIIALDYIPIIINFPEGDYSPISLFFESLGGRIKSTYKAVLNGFSGCINLSALNQFCDSLREFNIPFFIEEDRILHAQLYYTGKNMNLRPYVWNTLSYDGDEYSSIAIVDTGIDDSHNFFSPGYPDKIVGWKDQVNFSNSPYDDNGHGSHVSGIASGIGTPSYDVSGRTVSTAAYNFDYTGWDAFPGSYLFNWTRFNVTEPGLIELFCEFDDFTPVPDDVDFWIYLYYGNTIVDSYVVGSDSWFHTLSYTATSGSLGMYSFRFVLDLIDGDPNGYVSDFNIRFRSEIHWPFDPPQFGCGDPWKGVAPNANLVGVKVLDQYGSGLTSTIISGIEWVIMNKMAYNITTMSLSFGGDPGNTAMINAVNNAVENGIVTVVSAGNDGPGGDNVGSPGDADNVITVAAMSFDDEITDYSSQGGPSYTGNTIKPDITAPGGSANNLQIFSADTNDNDGETAYPVEAFANDLQGAQGTSTSAPAVAGASNLLIKAMGGHQSWSYTATEAKRVKALLLMTATETFPLLRETYGTSYSPLLNRGGKDVHEGYGRLNVDVAIEAYTQELTLGSQFNAWITSGLINPFNKHGLGCYANLLNGKGYEFTLNVPSGADFDLYLYSDNPSSTGEPIMVVSSTSPGLGTDEVITYTPTSTGKYFLIVKAISGEGNAIISLSFLKHDLSVSLKVPSNPDIGNTYFINATVFNTGIDTESDVDLILYLDGISVNSTTILIFPVGVNKTIYYTWSPIDYGMYNFTAYAVPLANEMLIQNNIVTEFLTISPLGNYIMLPDYNYTWVPTYGGTGYAYGGNFYVTISLPFDFPFYDQMFSTVHFSSNGWLSFVNPTPSSGNNIPFPSGVPDYHYMIAPFWDNLLATSGPTGMINVKSYPTFWVIEYENILHGSNGATVGRFEVVLYETGEIVFNYDYLDYTEGGYTCGLNLGVDTLYYNSYQGLTNLTDDFSILFTPPIFFEDFENGLSKWETIAGMWNLTNDTSSWPVPYHSPTHSMWFGNESTGDYNTGSREMGELISYPINLSSYEDSILLLEFYHWREGEGTLGRDVSFINISVDGVNWDLLYQNSSGYISPWEKVSVDISRYTGNSSVQIKFCFDTVNETENFYRGWLVDDIIIKRTIGPLATPLSLNIITPDNTNSWQVGTTHSINWNSTGILPRVKIQLYKEGVFVRGITGSTYNDGEFSWTIPSNLEESTKYQIKISDVYNPPIDDISDYFEIFIPRTLTIISPGSTSSWESGTTHSINWTSTGSITNVKIELYRNGLFELEIVANTTNDGGFSWTIPYGLIDSTHYQIKIIDVANPVNNVISNYFEIFNPALIITDPDSNTAWDTGSTRFITWTSRGTISSVKIELYRWGGFILEIVASTPNDGEFSWAIPLDLAESTEYQIKISDVANSATDDFSNLFEIFKPTLTITYPDRESSWETGTTHSIHWTSRGSINNIKIELYKDGVFRLEIVSSTPNDGSYSWIIPAELTDSSFYQIIIIDAANSVTDDVSDNFEITKPKKIGPSIPGYCLYLIIAIISILSIILIKSKIEPILIFNKS